MYISPKIETYTVKAKQNKNKTKKYWLISLAQIVFLLGAVFSSFSIPSKKVEAQNFIVTNTNDSGAGSLRQAITDLNTLCPAGNNAIVFNIPNTEPVAASATAKGKVNYSGGTYYRIVPLTELPGITCANTTVDGSTQTVFGGDSNPGQEGTGGVVGVDSITLNKVNKPEIEIKAGFVQPVTQTYGLQAAANNITIKNLAIFGFGKPNESGDIGSLCCSGLTVENNFIGTPASAFQDAGAGSRGEANGVYLESANNSTIRNNLIGYHDMTGVFVRVGSTTNILIEGNEVRSNNRAQNLAGPGIAFTDSTNIDGSIIRNNLVVGQDALTGADANNEYADFGIEITTPGTGRFTIENNTLTANGSGAVLAGGSNSIFTKNLVFNNDGKGLIVTGERHTISKNSFYQNDNTPSNNTSLAIDLDPDFAGVTPNDNGDIDTNGNAKFNFPILSAATITGSNLLVSGFARPGSVIELFIADPDPSGFGEGKTYLTTLTEGASNDADSGVGTYGPSAINGLSQGTDNTNRFSFTISTASLGASVNAGTILTSTATDSNGNTSEFSGNVTVGSSGGGGGANSVSAADDFTSTNINTPVTLNVFPNDTDPEGDSFTLTSPLSPTQTSHGSVQCFSNGSCTYVAQQDYTGSDTFVYTIADSKGATDTATVTITIVTSNPFSLTVGEVSGYIFYDLDNDGLFNNNDTPAPNIPVQITDANGVIYPLVTDNNGLYQTTIVSGSVTVSLDQNSPQVIDYTVTTQDNGGTPVQQLVLAGDSSNSFFDIGLYKPGNPPQLQATGSNQIPNFFLALILVSGSLFLQYFKHPQQS